VWRQPDHTHRRRALARRLRCVRACARACACVSVCRALPCCTGLARACFAPAGCACRGPFLTGCRVLPHATHTHTHTHTVAPAGYSLASAAAGAPCARSEYAPQFNRLARCLRCQSGLEEPPDSGLAFSQRSNRQIVCSEWPLAHPRRLRRCRLLWCSHAQRAHSPALAHPRAPSRPCAARPRPARVPHHPPHGQQPQQQRCRPGAS
jgi:hypothetical protein